MSVGEKLKLYRKYRKISQEEVAYRAGINEKYYGRIERNQSFPTIIILEKICLALNISMAELFIFEVGYLEKNLHRNIKIASSIIKLNKYEIDVHFNRNAMIENCESSIWHNGYLGSMSFDEFELKLFAVGNIKARLYLNYEEVLELDNDNVGNELNKYISSDEMLIEVIEFCSYDKKVLERNNGNALFVLENNWIEAVLLNNSKGEVMYEDIVLDIDNVMEALNNKELLFSYIFDDNSSL